MNESRPHSHERNSKDMIAKKYYINYVHWNERDSKNMTAKKDLKELKVITYINYVYLPFQWLIEISKLSVFYLEQPSETRSKKRDHITLECAPTLPNCLTVISLFPLLTDPTV